MIMPLRVIPSLVELVSIIVEAVRAGRERPKRPNPLRAPTPKPGKPTQRILALDPEDPVRLDIKRHYDPLHSICWGS